MLPNEYNSAEKENACTCRRFFILFFETALNSEQLVANPNAHLGKKLKRARFVLFTPPQAPMVAPKCMYSYGTKCRSQVLVVRAWYISTMVGFDYSVYEVYTVSYNSRIRTLPLFHTSVVQICYAMSKRYDVHYNMILDVQGVGETHVVNISLGVTYVARAICRDAR